MPRSRIRSSEPESFRVSEGLEVDSVADLCDLVDRGDEPLRFHGGGTKPALSDARAGEQAVALGRLSGVVAYDPSEYTVSVRSGTPVTELAELLGGHGQFLPFDPMLIDAGATVGGTVASGLSGPGRLGWGGLRDYLLEVRFVDGLGALVRGGGRVVKNAAGFDLPKLMVGSCGSLGPLVEVTLKVFPRPRTTRTFELHLEGADGGTRDAGDLRREQAAAAEHFLVRVNQARLEPEALEIELTSPARVATDGDPLSRPAPRVLMRFSGPALALERRLSRVRNLLEGELGSGLNLRLLDEDQQREAWRGLRELSWAESHLVLCKVPSSPKRVADLLSLREDGETWWISAGGQQVLLAVAPQRLAELSNRAPGLLPLRCPPEASASIRRPVAGVVRRHDEFASAVRQAVDPRGRFA